ncbi:hypothetical protein MAR_024409 [Mya arenaria]|uniref:Uncharacterized protein n=1 Tax=Mya arenaria TaxID=6604 RepID=A0ABY7DQP3_MYAAR|nr:hypothetical protein MAR_024409 [Mya arenaria]
MKTSFALTRGREMTGQQRVTWFLAMPAWAEVNNAMHELTVVNYTTGEQNKHMTEARQAPCVVVSRLGSMNKLLYMLTKRGPSETSSWLGWMDKPLTSNHLKHSIRSDDWWRSSTGGSSTYFPATHEIWYHCSNMSCAITHQHCLTPNCCFDSHIN